MNDAPIPAELQKELQRLKDQNAALPAITLSALRCAVTFCDEFPVRDDSKVALMSDAERESYFVEGATDKTLSADFLFFAKRLTPLLKPGSAIVVEEGLGGRFAEFMARSRQDIQVYAFASDPNMQARAQESLEQAGLADRVTLVAGHVGDAANAILARVGDRPIDMVVSNYVTHMQTHAANEASWQALSKLTQHSGATFATLDLYRTRIGETAEMLSRLYPGEDSGDAFKHGFERGLKYTSYRDTELEPQLEKHFGAEGWQRNISSTYGLIQLNIKPGTRAAAPGEAPPATYPAMPHEYVEVARRLDFIAGNFSELRFDDLTGALGVAPESDLFGRCKSTPSLDFLKHTFCVPGEAVTPLDTPAQPQPGTAAPKR